MTTAGVAQGWVGSGGSGAAQTTLSQDPADWRPSPLSGMYGLNYQVVPPFTPLGVGFVDGNGYAVERATPSPAFLRCTCGATKAMGAVEQTGAGHSDWCDLETGGAK